MLASNDPLHPQNFLEPGERLLWVGQPDPGAPLSRVVKFVRLFGYLCAVCFLVFAAIGWANRADLDGAGGILTGFLVLSAATAAALIWGLPWFSRAGRRKTRYGVTNTQAMIVNGVSGIRANMFRVRPEAEIERRQIGGGLEDIIFGRETGGVYTPHVPTLDPRQQTQITRLIGFEALTSDEAAKAAAALTEIKGAGGEGKIHELRTP